VAVTPKGPNKARRMLLQERDQIIKEHKRRGRPPKAAAEPFDEQPDDPVTEWARAVVAGEIVAGPHIRNTCKRHLLDLKDGPKRGLIWNLAAAIRAINFFPLILRLSQGDFDGMAFNLEPAQKFIIGSIFGWQKTNGKRRFRRIYVEIAKGSGKALALDTLIPTPSGWTTMGALQTGDHVLNEFGEPCRVVQAHAVQTDRSCYEIQFSDRAVIVADADHLWRTDDLHTTAEIADLLGGDRRKLTLMDGRHVVACDPVSSVPVRCITVDSPSGMFLAGREMVPTHNSPLAAGISLYCLIADGESQAQVFSAASMKPQARVVFDFAVRMWEQSPRLKAALTPTGKLTVQNLAHLASGSYFRPVSEDEGKLSGPMPSCAICDEVHEHRTDSIIRMLERGFKSRTQPLLIMITNSGSDRNSICWAEHQHAVKVAAGTLTPDADGTFVGEIIDDNEFSFVCGLDKDDDPLEDESCWIKANPLLGVTFPMEEMRRVVAQAKAIPGSLNLALRLHFCVWTDAETAWMSRPVLDACLAKFDPEELGGSDLYVGIDLSATRDLTAMAFVVPTGIVEVTLDDGAVVGRPTFDAWIEAWTPRDTMAQRAVKDQTPYDVWERQGFLHAEPGPYIALDFVAARLAEYVGLFNVRAVAFDAYAFRKNFEPELDHLGLKLNLVSHPQGGYRRNPESGLWMPGSKTELENLLMDRRIRLLRNPVLESSIMGAMISAPDPVGNTYFSKQKATVRIDPLIALAMAIGAATGTVEQKKEYQILVF